MIVLGLTVSAVLLGCGKQQELTSYCLEPGVTCPPCSTDDECAVLSNACHETATCVHRDDVGVAVTMEGCGIENDVPPDSDCVCIDTTCVTRE